MHKNEQRKELEWLNDSQSSMYVPSRKSGLADVRVLRALLEQSGEKCVSLRGAVVRRFDVM